MERETCTVHGRRKITGDGAGGTDASQLKFPLVFVHFAGIVKVTCTVFYVVIEFH